MERVNELLKELKPLMGATDGGDCRRMDEIIDELKRYGDIAEVRNAVKDFVGNGIEETRETADTIKRRYGDTYKLLPLSYIAETYFGKTRAWLYQRLNGYKVRGKVYRLNDREKELFNTAVKDVAARIGSVRLV